MKRFIPFLFIITLYTSSITPANAIYCSNCSTLATQIPQLAKEVITAGATLSTQVNTYASWLKITVLDPVANAMVAMSLLQQQNQTVSLITGSLGGNSLLIANPQDWIKNQGLNSVRISINDLTNQNTSYSGSILSSLIGTYRQADSLQSALQNIGTSNIPNIVQSNLCKDSQLTAIAKNDVADESGYASPNDVQRRKQELYNSLCVGNPNGNSLSSVELRNKLEQVNAQRPDIGGMDSFLALTVGGDNPYARSIRAQLTVAQDVAEKQKVAENNLNQGGGVASPTKCPGQTTGNNPSAFVDNGPVNIADALCRTPLFTQSSAALQNSFQVALSAPLQRLTQSFGSGILSSLGTLLAARNTVTLLRNAFGGNSISSSNYTSGQFPGDLAINPELKENIVTPILNQATTHEEALAKLEDWDKKADAEVKKRTAYAQSVTACFDNLVERTIVSPNDPVLASVGKAAEDAVKEVAPISQAIQQDKTTIPEARALIANLRSVLPNATTTAQVDSVYKVYSDKLAARSIPDENTPSIRESQYYEVKAKNDDDANGNSQLAAMAQDCHNREVAFNLGTGGFK